MIRYNWEIYVWMIVLAALILFILSFAFGYGYTILTVGDISCNHESLRTMNAILNYVKTNHVDTLVFLGDAEYGGSWQLCTKSFFNQISNYTTLRMTMGNHDPRHLYDFMPFNLSKNNPVWYEVKEGILMIGMDTDEPWNATSPQYKQVTQILDTQASQMTLVFMHKQSVETCRSGKDPSMCGFYELYNPLFQKYHVDCVVAAHKHSIAMLQRDGLCYTVYGSGGAFPYASNQRYLGFEIKYASVTEHGFVVLDTEGDGIMHKFFTNNGNLIRKYYEAR